VFHVQQSAAILTTVDDVIDGVAASTTAYAFKPTMISHG
jgi:hypothetical protein